MVRLFREALAGYDPRSIVFPRNQVAWTSILRERGIRVWRDNPTPFYWQATSQAEQSRAVRALRLADSLAPLGRRRAPAAANRASYCPCRAAGHPLARPSSTHSVGRSETPAGGGPSPLVASPQPRSQTACPRRADFALLDGIQTTPQAPPFARLVSSLQTEPTGRNTNSFEQLYPHAPPSDGRRPARGLNNAPLLAPPTFPGRIAPPVPFPSHAERDHRVPTFLRRRRPPRSVDDRAHWRRCCSGSSSRSRARSSPSLPKLLAISLVIRDGRALAPRPVPRPLALLGLARPASLIKAATISSRLIAAVWAFMPDRHLPAIDLRPRLGVQHPHRRRPALRHPHDPRGRASRARAAPRARGDAPARPRDRRRRRRRDADARDRRASTAAATSRSASSTTTRASTASSIHGVPVLGPIDERRASSRSASSIDEIILAIPSLRGQRDAPHRRALPPDGRARSARSRASTSLIDGRVTVSQLAEVDDRRPPRPRAGHARHRARIARVPAAAASSWSPAPAAASAPSSAGRSAASSPKRLVLVERAENSLFEIHRELARELPATSTIVPVHRRHLRRAAASTQVFDARPARGRLPRRRAQARADDGVEPGRGDQEQRLRHAQASPTSPTRSASRRS